MHSCLSAAKFVLSKFRMIQVIRTSFEQMRLVCLLQNIIQRQNRTHLVVIKLTTLTTVQHPLLVLILNTCSLLMWQTLTVGPL